jgi:hypothetical protein
MRTWPLAAALILSLLVCRAIAQTSSEQGAALALFLLGLARSDVTDDKGAQEAPAATAEETVRYVCVHCAVLSTTPCSCATCRQGMVPARVLAIRNGVAYCCVCAAGDPHTSDAGVPASRRCDKEIVTISLRGRYVCGCGPRGRCGGFSDNPGVCVDGKDAQLVE